METINCPACGTNNPVDAVQCSGCQEDLVAVKELMDSAKTHYNEALALAHSGKLDEATGQIEAALTLFGHNSEYHNLLGTILAQKEQYEGAIRAWERCLALDSGMENAYRNIGKAQDMIDEEAEEQRKRPFLLTAIGASILAAIFLLTTGFFAVHSLYKNKKIASLTNDLDIATTAGSSWKKKFETLNARFPAQGIQGLTQLIDNQKKEIEKQAGTINSLNERWKKGTTQRSTDVLRYRGQITTLQDEKAQLQKRVGTIGKLQAVNTANELKIRTYLKTIETHAAMILSASNEVADLKARLGLAQRSLDTVKSDHSENLDSVKKTYDKTVESLRSQLNEREDEIGEFERDRANRHYANGLTIDALKKTGNNDYPNAFQALESALSRHEKNIVALYLRDEIRRVLDDPVERETRNREFQNRNELRETVRSQLADRNLSQAKDHFKQGRFTLAVESARQAIAILPDGAREVKTCQKLIQDAELDEEKMAMWLTDARLYLSQQNYKQALTMVKLALKRAPAHEEALALQKQLKK